MKKLIIFAICLFTMSLAFSQNSGHIKFMGVEVNGQQSTVEQRLTTKGFTRTKDNMYKGKFSGYDVKLDLHKSVKSKTIYGISVVFGKEVTREQLQKMVKSLKEKYTQGTFFESVEDGVSTAGVRLPEGIIVMDYDHKTLSYLDNANMDKDVDESKDDL
ncbi:MAG: hypothetical protein IJU33_11225 [Bacteroidales bacterium]|nr:hypothetical protein [Bacteroidales bacterium]